MLISNAVPRRTLYPMPTHSLGTVIVNIYFFLNLHRQTSTAAESSDAGRDIARLCRLRDVTAIAQLDARLC